MTGLVVLLVTLVAGLVVGVAMRRRDGRIRLTGTADTATGTADTATRTADTATGTADTLPAAVAEVLDGDAVTLVQISTTFCAPCRQTRALLSHLAERTEGLRHVDLDVTDRPHVAHDLGVLRTPTTIAYAPQGRELLRVGGVPKSAELLAALEPHLVPQTERGSRDQGA
ncbi:TlpA family protein disulfide reductase [Prauserella oleivorans]|uniref:TlpA family protein disulfide reductase n=1 Tax=Prauserella oleivorans TaxID=1478153 RepID=A0ABW5WA87_9PSEU